MFVLIGMDGTGSYGYLYSERRNRKEFASRPFFAMSLRDARACPKALKLEDAHFAQHLQASETLTRVPANPVVDFTDQGQYIMRTPVISRTTGPLVSDTQGVATPGKSAHFTANMVK